MALITNTVRLSLRSCLPAFETKRGVRRQENFEGLFDAYFWDNQNGFGFTDTGHLTLVSKDTASTKEQDYLNDVWFKLLDSQPEINHLTLRDQLQMNVLSYDNDVIQPHILRDVLKEYSTPVYRADVNTMIETPVNARKKEAHAKDNIDRDD